MKDVSPAGARDQLEVHIKQKCYRAPSGAGFQVLDRVDFKLQTGEVAALVGPSGCGKTTLLRIIAGLDRDFHGNVVFSARVTLGMVFQEPRLLAWRTVEQNVRLAAGPADRILFLSPSPARVLAEFPVTCPRRLDKEQITALREEIARRLQ